ncbi:hypothetical protein [Planomicrobium sp. Y74]|uniref:hypothetical protein n=1 Tax=Planomicrobium sp. Y74 TaxID=2478977 RepID=UPI000EF446BD|nr:hypothetical protein [Planomicrobium sp. Y74]RLQ84870.1 hypothetical protein D9754_16480 [Planomicrobium sp. Y74]
MNYYPTCSICSHLNPLTNHCHFWDENQSPLDQELPVSCVKENIFLRDMNVLLDSYHLYLPSQKVPADFRQDFHRLPKDEKGIPLFVRTYRGIERPLFIPDAPQVKGDRIVGVPRIYTYQGQRELAHDLGMKSARVLAAKFGVQLHIQEEETE